MNQESLCAALATEDINAENRLSVLSRAARSTRDFAFAHVVTIPLIVSLALSLALISYKNGLFTVSFLTMSALTPTTFLAFLAATTLMDWTVLQTILVVWSALSRLLRWRTYAIGFIVFATTAVVVVNFLAYNVMLYMGDLLRIDAMLQVSDG